MAALSSDYDNAFDGCTFINNSYGVYADKMANVYVRNSRFEASSAVDVFLAPGAGNSVRRCVSTGSSMFVAAPHHSAVSPTTIEDCRVDGWTGPAAISYGLRGPLTLLDNQFTNSNYTPVAFTPWPQVFGAILFAGNTVNGKPAIGADLLPKSQHNIQVLDLPVETAPHTRLSPTTQFAKHWWPGVPTKYIPATKYGCTGQVNQDATACTQATIDAAAAIGGGVAAYFPPGTYAVNSSLSVSGGKNFSVHGGGFGTQFVWTGDTLPVPAVIAIKGGGGGLRLAHFQVICGGKGLSLCTKVLHDGTIDSAPPTSGVAAGRLTVYDEVYTGTGTGDVWNATGFRVHGLAEGDMVHFIHLDGNLEVDDSASGTVLLNFMIQGSLNVSGNTLPNLDNPFPSVGALTMVGLTDHDMNVNDDQSAVVTDYYSEQIKTGHLRLSGSGASSGHPGGRVTISAVKSQCYTPDEITAVNYHGSLYYSSSFFFEGPSVRITQRGATEMNISIVGNAFWGDTDAAVTLDLASGAEGRVTAIANLLANYSGGPQNRSLPEQRHAGTDGAIAAALLDFRRLGAVDLYLNHPQAIAAAPLPQK